MVSAVQALLAASCVLFFAEHAQGFVGGATGAGGLLGTTEALATLRPDCSQATLRLLLSCADPINEGLAIFNVDGVGNIGDLAQVNFRSRSAKRKLRRFRNANLNVSRGCCAAVRNFNDRECGCLDEISDLVDTLGGDTFVNAVVRKVSDECSIDNFSFLTLGRTCSK